MIGNRLYLLRKAAGLSQAELGDMLSVSHHTISAYEKRKSDPSDATKVWLARFFGVSVDYLMGLSDERYPGYAAASSDVLLLPEGLTEEQRSAVQDYALFSCRAQRISSHPSAPGAPLSLSAGIAVPPFYCTRRLTAL